MKLILMRLIPILWVAEVALAGLPVSVRADEADRLKSDLIGHCMGGREKCWKFQSPEQIKKLEIRQQTDDGARRVYVVALELRAAKGEGRYAAEARIEYVKSAGNWKIKQIGLLSLIKIE